MDLICALHLGNDDMKAVTIIEGWALCPFCAGNVLTRNLRYPDGRLVVFPPENTSSIPIKRM
jgi:hypothetical protein